MTSTLSTSLKRTFRLAGAATAVIGVGFSAAAVAFPGVLDALYRLAGPAAATDMGPAARLGAGIYGGLMAGWGLMLHLLGRDVPVARAAALGLLGWWTVDSAASIAVGYPLNAVSNAAFLALFTPVLLALRPRQARTAPAAT